MRKSDSSQRLLRALLALSLVSQWHNVHASVSVPFVVHSPSIDINTNSKAPGDAGSFSFQNINDATGADVYVAAIKVGDQNYVVRSPTSFPRFSPLMVSYIGATGHWQLRPLARYIQGLYLPIHQHRVRFIHHLWRWHRRTGSHSHRFSRVRGFLSATTGLQCVLLLILTHIGVDKDLLSLGTWFKCNDKWRHGLARCWPTSTFPDQ